MILGLTACSSSDDSAAKSAAPVEESSAQTRLAYSHDGGVAVVDGKTLKKVADFDYDGFVRVNSAGDGRHVFVSTSKGFELLDLGVWREAHGDHAHYYSAEPKRTDISYDGAKPGHVVVHDGRTTLFNDGTGQVRVLDTAKIGKKDAVIEEFKVPAHHGVAVARADGSVVISVGDTEKRTGLAIRDDKGATVAENKDCPGLHGEAAAAGGVLSFGCEDGTLIVRGNEITKIKAADPYARLGNQIGTDESPIVLADYKTEKDNEHEHPRRFSLIDTDARAIKVVGIESSYAYKSLGRGQAGEAVILGTDGALHVFDPATGTRTAHYPVIGAWTEPEDWQEAFPGLRVVGNTAYVNDPAKNSIVAVSLLDGKQVALGSTEKPAIEMAVVKG
ncbi:MAG: hypothetical protein QM658_15620 [Gordonia sp. (in: high G+C Gram-positive bacteria)]